MNCELRFYCSTEIECEYFERHERFPRCKYRGHEMYFCKNEKARKEIMDKIQIKTKVINNETD